MSLSFVIPEINIGGSDVPSPIQFYKRGFELGSGASPSWQDIILSGNTALTLTNAKANGLNYLKLFGGTEQRNLPVEYTQVEYLQSDGACYIDLLRVPNNNDIIEQKFQILATGSGTFSWYGSMPSSSQTVPRIGIGVFGSGQTRKFFCGANGTADVASANTDVNTIRFQATGEREITYTYNGETVAYTPPQDINTLDPAVTLTSYLFARHGEDGVQTYDGSGTRIFYHKEYLANGTLALYVVPCRRNSDNVLGMYDTVTGNFLTNAGTGTFTAGADVTPSPETPMDIICNNGVIKGYATAEGFSIQDGIPTPANQLPIKNFEQGGMVLRKVGDYADTYDATTKTITRNVGVKILDGTESWGFSTTQYVANLILPDMAYGDGSGSWAINGLTTHYVGTSLQNANMPDYSIKYSNTTAALTTARIFVKPNYTTLQAFKEFLTQQYQNNTPVTLYYPLLTPTTEVWNDDYYIDGITETVENTGKNLAKILTASGGVGYVKIPQGLLNKTVTLSSSATDFMQYTIGNTAYTGIWTSANKTTTFTVTQAMIDTVGLWVRKQSTYGAMTPEELASINLQLEIGSTATEYESYYNYGSATADNLLSVGDYVDTQEILSGTVTRNVGVMVLNGLEDWEYVSATYPYFRVVTDIPTNSRTTASNELCTHCIPLNVGGSNANQSISITKRSSAYSYLYLFARLDEVCEATSENLTIWKQWLTAQYANGTPVIIVYPLATPTTETVTGQPLSIQAGTNIVEITEASIDNLELEVSYKGVI